MKITNNQFPNETISLLRSLKGKNLDSMTHESYVGVPSSYGAVYLSIDKQKYEFAAYEEPMDYFRATEDVSKARFEVHNETTSPSVTSVKFVTDKIGQKISGITLVNTEDVIKVKETGEEYAFLDTLGIIFTLENNIQFSLTKDGIFESISVYLGNDAKGDIQSFLNKYLDHYSSEVEGKSKVTYIDL